jgi:two-component system sensor histidine kinase EvgS
VKYTDAGEVKVAFGAAGPGPWFEVRDTGQGIPIDAQARIFEPFEQVENADPGQATGVGLGLSLVKGIVDALGATIRVASEPGRGSAFRVVLPEEPPDPAPPGPAAQA